MGGAAGHRCPHEELGVGWLAFGVVTTISRDASLAYVEVEHCFFGSRVNENRRSGKSLDGWALVEGRGKRAFVPPDDPRHPRHANAPPRAA